MIHDKHLYTPIEDFRPIYIYKIEHPQGQTNEFYLMEEYGAEITGITHVLDTSKLIKEE